VAQVELVAAFRWPVQVLVRTFRSS